MIFNYVPLIIAAYFLCGYFGALIERWDWRQEFPEDDWGPMGAAAFVLGPLGMIIATAIATPKIIRRIKTKRSTMPREDNAPAVVNHYYPQTGLLQLILGNLVSALVASVIATLGTLYIGGGKVLNRLAIPQINVQQPQSQVQVVDRVVQYNENVRTIYGVKYEVVKRETMTRCVQRDGYYDFWATEPSGATANHIEKISDTRVKKGDDWTSFYTIVRTTFPDGKESSVVTLEVPGKYVGWYQTGTGEHP